MDSEGGGGFTEWTILMLRALRIELQKSTLVNHYTAATFRKESRRLRRHVGTIVTALLRDPTVTNPLDYLKKTARHYIPTLYGDLPRPLGDNVDTKVRYNS